MGFRCAQPILPLLPLRSSILTPRPARRLFLRLLDAAQKPRVVFEPIIEPIILGPEGD
jgi:hypothetical protein